MCKYLLLAPSAPTRQASPPNSERCAYRLHETYAITIRLFIRDISRRPIIYFLFQELYLWFGIVTMDLFYLSVQENTVDRFCQCQCSLGPWTLPHLHPSATAESKRMYFYSTFVNLKTYRSVNSSISQLNPSIPIRQAANPPVRTLEKKFLVLRSLTLFFSLTSLAKPLLVLVLSLLPILVHAHLCSFVLISSV
jgi:hypothetical protein